MNTKIDERLLLASSFLEQAWEELKGYCEKKDEVLLRQAAEKGWGCVVQALKVVNPEIKRHAEFGKTALKLTEEYNNEEIFRLEAVGEHLHRAGFYEGFLDEEEVKHGLLSVEDFLKLINGILNGKGRH
ncbi:PaREP1 family protein [bacterium]|nr:PaREP1 family protein [bacterium]MBU1599219.1 PaREP1 family protein [bacterium]